MKINDSAGRLGLYQDARYLVGLEISDTSSYTIHNFIRNANAWYRKVNSWIWEATSLWEYDDSNYANLPIATTNLVDEQQDYELPSSAQRIMRVAIKDDSGDWHLLSQIDQSEIGDAMSEYLETAGLPSQYDIIGRSLMLYPKPSSSDVTLSSGLKIYLAREIDEFTVTDTDTEPGFDSNFHRVCSLGPAQDYLLSNFDPDDIYRINKIAAELKDMKEGIYEFYGARNIAKKDKLNPSNEGEFNI